MGIGVLVAFMVITPLSPRGEVSFLLDRNKVAVINERLRVDNAMYRGLDDQGRPFSLTAGEAVQRSGSEGIVRMDDLVARILLSDGPARLSAPAGQYDLNRESVAVDGPVQLVANDGYRMEVSGVTVDLKGQTMAGAGGVSGSFPGGTFSASRIDVDIPERTLLLSGNARMQMIPGKVSIPQ